MKSNITYKLIRGVGRPIMNKKYCINVINPKNILLNEPLIVCPNHYHYCDQYTVETAMHNVLKSDFAWKKKPERVIRWFAKEEYSRGIKSVFYKSAGCIFVNRGGPDSKECLSEGEQVIERGDSVGIFPEGTRNSFFNVYYALQLVNKKIEELLLHNCSSLEYREQLEQLLSKREELTIRLQKIRYDLQRPPKNSRITDGDPILGFHKGASILSKKMNVSMLPVAVTGDYDTKGANLYVNFGEPVSAVHCSEEEAIEELHGKVLTLVNENRKVSNWMNEI